MRDDEMDRILSRDEQIAPSSGFVSSVMDAVRREAATPPPIPFPWERAAPGLAGWAVTLGAMVLGAFGWIEDASGTQIAAALAGLEEAGASIGAGWIILALLVSLVSVKLSMRLAGARE
jgi:hypothetical protein